MPLVTALVLMSSLAFAPPTTPPDPQDTPLHTAVGATAATAVVSGAGIALNVSALETRRDEHERALLEPPCNSGEYLGCLELDILPDPGAAPAIALGALSNGFAIGFSAGAGHLWAQRDIVRGRMSRASAITTTTVGSAMMAAGIGLHVAGWLQQGTDCSPEIPDVAGELACWRRTTQHAEAMTSVGSLVAISGAGLVGYGATLLRAGPTLRTSRHGASLGLRLSF